ncbi:MAG: DUF4870 domain-containing protein [Rubrobacteraceae bacterium]
MQEEPRREEGSRLRRIPVRGPGDSSAGNTAENSTPRDPAAAEDPAYSSPTAGGPLGGGSETGSWETGDPAGYAERDRMDGASRGTGGAPMGTMGAQDEQTWSMLSHLSVLVGLIGLMPFGALIIWLVYKDRSPRVGFHALQSLWYQVAWLVIWIVAGVLGGLFTLITFGIGIILVIPLGILIWLAPIVHGCYAAYKVNQGVDYRYPYIADRIGGPRRTL